MQMLDTTTDALDAALDTAADAAEGAANFAGDVLEVAADQLAALADPIDPRSRSPWRRRLLGLAVLTLIVGIVIVVMGRRNGELGETDSATMRGVA